MTVWNGTRLEAAAAVLKLCDSADVESNRAVITEVIDAAVDTRPSIVCWLVSIGLEDLARRVHDKEDEIPR